MELLVVVRSKELPAPGEYAVPESRGTDSETGEQFVLPAYTHVVTEEDLALQRLLIWAPGDVLDYGPDGRTWGREELANPDWRVVRVDGLTEAEAFALVHPEIPVGPPKQQLIRNRGLFLDLEALPKHPVSQARRHSPDEAHRVAGAGGVPRHDLEITAAALRKVRRWKDPIPHPDHLGPLGEAVG